MAPALGGKPHGSEATQNRREIQVKVCVTGATRFVGAHVARALAQRGDEVRVIYRNPERLKALNGVPYRRSKADVLDYHALRRALRGSDVLFHVAGYVASSPIEHVWQLNARGPDIAVQAAAAAGVRRVVVTSTISAIGVANGNGPANERTDYPDGWLGLVYPDSKHAGERAALEAADQGEPGERYILGGVNLPWPHLIDRAAQMSGVRYPIMVLPRVIGRLRRVREALGLPGAISAEAFELMGQDWRFSSQKARDELGYRPRPLDHTLRATIDWYAELIEAGAFADARGSGLSRWADSMQMASRLGLLTPVRIGQRVVGRRLVAGG
jgi:nucleoside-diphosphate-sugar epimerase